MPSAIPRTDWQNPAQPVTGPARRAPFQQGVVHYEGVERDETPADIPAFLRRLQAGYIASRSYSLGYGYAIVSDVRHPDDGSCWEIRGADLNMASNPGRKWAAEGGVPTGNANNWTGSVLLIGPSGVNASEKAAASVRELFAEWHTEAGTVPVRPFPHSRLDWTSCCGDPYTADLNAGRFDPVAAPIPPDPTPEEPPHMIAYYALPPENMSGNPPHLVVIDAAVRYRSNFDNLPDVPEHRLNAEQYGFMLRSAGLADASFDG